MELGSAEKLRLAAQLIEDVAYAQAGYQSQQKVAHLMLVAASLDKLTAHPEDFAETKIWPSLVRP
jgi:hypothetical protein